MFKEILPINTKELNLTFCTLIYTQITPFTETPANQIFYTHGTRPPTGVKNIPSGLIREIKGRYNKENQQTDSSEIHTEDKPYYRNHEMEHKITRVRQSFLFSRTVSQERGHLSPWCPFVRA